MKKTIAVLAAGLVSLAVHASAADFAHKVEAGGVTFEWKVDGANLNAKLTAKTTGWVGVGFNPTKDMQDAAFVIGAFKDGTARAALFIGTSPSAHSKEVEQDFVSNVAGKEENGVTEISFTIPLNYPKNPKVKPIAVDKDIDVLLAYSPEDTVKAKHRDRAHFKLNLTTGAKK